MDVCPPSPSEPAPITFGDQVFPHRKVFFKTYGCQMNHHDTERMLSHLKRLNFYPTENRKEADLILFNSCAIRDLANQKFYSHVGETKANKGGKKGVKVGVGGCIAQVEGKRLLKRFPHVDFAFGTDVIDSINDFVYRAYSGEDKFSVTTWDRASDYSIETKITHGQPLAFVNIIKGCDKFCSYCIVPFTRGREKSRTIAEVEDDVRRLVECHGVQGITLLGQNVNSFGKEHRESLADLIRRLDRIEGLEIIRYTTSHPYDMGDDLIAAHGECHKLADHVHLPVQSGSNTVLARMLREYTVEHFLSLCDKLRKANPNLTLSTDIIVGFPNETQEEYRDTLALLDRGKFDFIYAYTFSPRKGTKAARMNDSLSDEERGRRLRELQKHQLRIQENLRKPLVGKVFRILVEKKGVMNGVERWQGRSNCMRIVHIDPPQRNDVTTTFATSDLEWHWVDVEVTSSTALSCRGRLLKDYGKTLPSGLSAKILSA
ncbi:MAG: tRNA (N6-isopentenyl adenosine(37)-C2)-methylthiotransferase MiaB [Bacteriovoracales bacterium]|nr:tRNA (N6-isopentenyl adenosine(37)-C2)-methylthiotransferase MiaB [Bacteriovoracales bacterium]